MIQVIGSLNMDLVIQAPCFPRAGETIVGSQFRTIPGGKGGNQAVAAARLGALVRMAGCVGADAFGRELKTQLERERVDASCVCEVSDAATGVALIVVENSGENRIVLAPGANLSVSPEQAERVAAALDPGDVLLLQLEIPLGAVQAAARVARTRRAHVFLNAAPAMRLGSDTIGAADVLLVNETEAGLITGTEPTTVSQAQQAARHLCELGARVAIVTLGARGAVLVAAAATLAAPAPRVAVVDTTAAGDAFAGALACAWRAGRDLAAALHFAIAAGSLACTRLGAQTSLPTRAELATAGLPTPPA